ncbi:MAG: N-acetylmuramoyl-L-alanine amidase [Treponemataceae bacterium]|nr:N-acetylmuramoyl-L-alanine amidase [Treponemataceae bacterium]
MGVPTDYRREGPKKWNKGRLLLGVFLLFFVIPLVSQESFLSLEETLRRLSATFSYDPLGEVGVLEIGDHRCVFPMGLSQEGQPVATLIPVLIDATTVFYTEAPIFQQGKPQFPPTFVETLRQRIAQLEEEEKNRFRIAAIVIDPGHGGKDPGAIGELTKNGKKITLREKDITLTVGKELYGLLKKHYPDKRILLTRNEDIYVSLEDRVAIANSVPLKEHEAIIYISLHLNASFNKNGRGYEVWYLSPEYRRTLLDPDRYEDSKEILPILNAMLEEEFTTESILIAQGIHKRLTEEVGTLLPSRGIKAAEWFVVRNTRMPAILVELGFITNQQDALLLYEQESLSRFVKALYNGIVDFTTTFERSGGFVNHK